MDRIEWQASCFFATAALHVVGRLHIAQPVSNSFLTEKKVDSMRPSLVGRRAVSLVYFSAFTWTHVVVSCSTGRSLSTCCCFFRDTIALDPERKQRKVSSFRCPFAEMCVSFADVATQLRAASTQFLF